MGWLQKELGTFDGRDIVRYYGSFALTDASGTPGVIRDGRRAHFTVTRISTGLFEVTVDSSVPCVPERLIYESANLSCAAVLAAKAQGCYVVVGSWTPSTRKFRIVTYTVGDVALSAYTDPAVGDPNSGDRINFELIGSICSSGTDLA